MAAPLEHTFQKMEVLARGEKVDKGRRIRFLMEGDNGLIPPDRLDIKTLTCYGIPPL